MLLQQGKLVFVAADEGDAEIGALLTTLDDIRNLSETHLYPAHMPTTLYFKIRFSEKTVGMAHIKNIRWFNRKAEFSLFFKKDYRGRGLGRQALEMLMEYVFLTMNFHRLEAEVLAYNTPMQKLLKKVGFRVEGELREARYLKGKYYSIFRYGLLRQEYLENHKNG